MRDLRPVFDADACDAPNPNVRQIGSYWTKSGRSGTRAGGTISTPLTPTGAVSMLPNMHQVEM